MERNVEKIIKRWVRSGKEGGDQGECKVCADFLKVESSWLAEAATKSIYGVSECVRLLLATQRGCQSKAHCKLLGSGW